MLSKWDDSSHPLLDHIHELFGFCHNLYRFGLGGDKGVIVINHVPLAPASIEVVAVGVRCFANRELNDFKRDPVVPSSYDAVASTCNRHFCGLQGRIVCGCKTQKWRLHVLATAS